MLCSPRPYDPKGRRALETLAQPWNSLGTAAGFAVDEVASRRGNRRQRMEERMHSAEEFRDDPGRAKGGNISKITAAMRPVIALGTAATLTLLLGVTPALIATAWGSRGTPAVKIAAQDHSAQNQKNNGKKPRDSSDGLTAALQIGRAHV